MKGARRARLLIAGAFLLIFVAAGVVGAFRSGEYAQAVALFGLGVVITLVAVRGRADAARNPRRSMLLGTLAAAAVSASMLVLAVTEDDAVGRLLAGIAGALFALLAVTFGFVLWKLERRARVRRTRSVSASTAAAVDQQEQLESGIVFFREDALQDAMRSYKIEVDERLVGVLKPESTLAIPLPPGVHSCRARISWTGSPPVSLEVPQGPPLRVLVAPTPEPPSLRKSLSRTSWLALHPE